jgi:hypothetical protein
MKPIHSALICAASMLVLSACRKPPGGAVDAGDCPVNVACRSPLVWDPEACDCVPDTCPDNIVCRSGTHLDEASCACVPDACSDNVVCMAPLHWDTTLCACVGAPDAGP